MKKSIFIIFLIFVFSAPSIYAEETKTIKGTVYLPDNLTATEDVKVTVMVEHYRDQYSWGRSPTETTIKKGNRSAQYELVFSEDQATVTLCYSLSYSKTAVSGQAVYLNKSGVTSVTAAPFSMPESTLTVNFTALKGNKAIKGSFKCGSEVYSSDDLAINLHMQNIDEPSRSCDIGPIIISKGQKLEYEFSVYAAAAPVSYEMSIYAMSKNGVYEDNTVYYSSTGNGEWEYAIAVPISSSSNLSIDFPLTKNQLLSGKLKLAKNASVPSGCYTKVTMSLVPIWGGGVIRKDIYIEENKNEVDYSIGIPQYRKNEEFILECEMRHTIYKSVSPANPLPNQGTSTGGGGSGGSGGGGSGGRYWENLIENNKTRYYPRGQLYFTGWYSNSKLTNDFDNADIFTFQNANATNINFTLEADDDYYFTGFVCSYLTIPDEGLNIEVQLEDSVTGAIMSKNTVTIDKYNNYVPYKLVSERVGSFIISMRVLNRDAGYDNERVYHTGSTGDTVNYNRSAAKTVALDESKPRSFDHNMFYGNICPAQSVITISDSSGEYSAFPRGGTIILYSRDKTPISIGGIYASTSVTTGLSEFAIGVKIGSSELYYSEEKGLTNDFSEATLIRIYSYRENYRINIPLVTGYAKGIENSLTVKASYLSNFGSVIIYKNSPANGINLIVENSGAARYDEELYCIQSRNGKIINTAHFNLDIPSGRNHIIKEIDFDMEETDEVKIFFWDSEMKPLINKIIY